MAEIEKLLKKTQINVDRANKLKKSILGKFQSHPTATSGVLLRLQTLIDKFGRIGEEVENECLEIATLSKPLTDKNQQTEIYAYALDTPFEITASHVEMLEKLENLRVKYHGITGPEQPDSASGRQLSNTGLKLRDIEVPPFYGETRKFAEFKSVFVTPVHDNPGVVKL